MWREDLDPEIKAQLSSIVKKSTEFKESYDKADNIGGAQLWCALAILQKELEDQKLKIKLLEGVLKELSPKKPKEDNIDPAKELSNVLKKA